MKIEYINGDPLNGIVYDFNFLRNEFRRLKCPKDVYNPSHLPFETCKWFITLSERARGKTTNLLLFGMLIFWHYGTGICYVRSNEAMIMPKASKDLFSNIVSWGYIEKISKGKYNNVFYKSRRWYFSHVNEDGEVDAVCDNAFCIMLSIDKNEQYKSVLETKNDFIIFDEFIERFYYPNQFVLFCDLCKTIIRQRSSAIICLSANTIDLQSPWFNELQIREKIETMGQGDQETITTPKGTRVYMEILGKKTFKANKKQQLFNRLYYGFDNPKLASITGSDTWAMYNYPHTPDKFKIIDKRHYLEYNDKLINLEICESIEGRIFINCHPATNTYDDSIIYSLDFSTDMNDRYMFGFTKRDRLIWDKYDANLFTFSDNTVGSLIDKYVEICRKGVK
jgi:hypothetical protein